MTISGKSNERENPLGDLEEWDYFIKERYPEPAEKNSLVGTNPEKTEDQFRDYEAEARDSVKEFYRLNLVVKHSILFAIKDQIICS